MGREQSCTSVSDPHLLEGAMRSDATHRAWITVKLGIVLFAAGCGVLPSPSPTGETAGPAEYLGTATCSSCHSSIRTSHQHHGHAQALKRIEGAPPVYPSIDTNAGVPLPPADFDWADISHVIGGYVKAANFVDIRRFYSYRWDCRHANAVQPGHAQS